MANYAQTQGVRLVEAMVEKGGPIFSVEAAITIGRDLGLNRGRVYNLLSQMYRSGWLARLKRGVYVVQSPLFKQEVHPFAVAKALVEPTAISHWSALAHHGLTTQIPAMIQASTPKKVVTPEMREGKAYKPRGHSVWKALDMEFEFIKVKESHFFGWEEEWVSSWHRIKIMDAERTLLETIAHPEYFGGIRFGIETLDRHWDEIKGGQLVAYAVEYDVGAVVKRLGWILERLDVGEILLEELLDYEVQNYYPLDPQGSRDGQPNTRWRVVENLRIG